MCHNIPISLYIHIPWCLKKCPYCDFNSHVVHQDIPEKNYLEALLTDFENQVVYLETRKINTVFIGGGTPSLMGPEFYYLLFEKIMPYLNPHAEITLEANPGTENMTKENGHKLREYRHLGINRLSLGIQSLQHEKLKQLGRVHSKEEAIHAILLAQEAGFDQLNCDLMFGLPNQTIEEALQDLMGVIEHHPTHISWYQLTLEPNTYFYRNPPCLPTQDYIVDMQCEGQALLSQYHYQPYEVSAYATAEHHQCQHNLNYWLFGDYLGIGAGAHGKITDLETKRIFRTENHKHPKLYMSAHKKQLQTHTVTASELPFEFLLNTLRLYQSIPFQLFEERCQLPSNILRQHLASSMHQGLVECFQHHFHLTDKGRWFIDSIMSDLCA